MFEELRCKAGDNIGKYKDAMERLKEREACALRIGFKETHSRTKKEIENERKKQMHESNVQKFARVVVGVYGRELPKFTENGA